MADHNKLGNKGEDVAAEFLIKKGCKIKARNWQFGHLEIDIIAEFNEIIIFAEVKSRSGTYFEQPYQAVKSVYQQKFVPVELHAGRFSQSTINAPDPVAAVKLQK